MKKRIIKQQGLTLLSLVVTIIIILILAGISIDIATTGGFLDKANNAKEMNENAIAKSEHDEKNALKEDAEEFKVDDNYIVSGIEICEAVTKEKQIVNKQTGEKYKNTGITETTLEPINISLLQYLKEKEGKQAIYFRAETNRTTLTYTVNNSITGKEYPIEYQKITETPGIYNGVNYKEYDIEESCEDAGVDVDGNPIRNPIRTTIIKLELEESDLNGLNIEIKRSDNSSLYKLSFEAPTDEELLYIPTGTYTYFGTEEPLLSGITELKKIDVDINENEYISPKTSITVNEQCTYSEEETRIEQGNTSDTADSETTLTVYKQKFATINEESKKSNTYRVLNPAKFSLIQERKKGLYSNLEFYLYLVKEKEENNTKIMTLYDYPITFYNPVYSIELTSPKNVIYTDTEKQIIYLAKSKNGENADLSEDEEEREFKATATNLTVDNYSGKMWIDTVNNKIMSTFSEIDTDKETDWIINMQITDIGGNKINQDTTITVTSSRFRVFATGTDDSIKANKGVTYWETNSLLEALSQAITIKAGDNDKAVTIKQLTRKYNIEDQNIYGTTSDGKEYIDFAGINNLTYDLNGKTLNLKDYAYIKIPENINFTLISSARENGDYKATKAGSINFNHPVTYVFESAAQNASQTDFLSDPRYAKYESLETYLKARYIRINWYNKLLYWDEYLTERLDAYTEYMHQFNQLAYNIKFDENFSAIENYGTFNFESGNIIVNTEEELETMGIISGSIVFNITDVFLEFLNRLGVKTTDLSQLLGTYAQIENTGAGIKNFGVLNLGKYIVDAENNPITGELENTIPHPEIFVYVDSEQMSASVTTGTLKNPNKVISRSYGVWNSDQNSSINMYSGFMSMILVNKTNSPFEIFSIGKSYGIFNEQGTVTISGVTVNNIDTNDKNNSSVYKFLKEKVNVDDWSAKYSPVGKTFTGFFTNAQLKFALENMGVYSYNTYSYAVVNGSGTVNLPDFMDNKSTYKNNAYQTVIYNAYDNFWSILPYLAADSEEDLEALEEKVGVENLNRMEWGWLGTDRDIQSKMDTIMSWIFE